MDELSARWRVVEEARSWLGTPYHSGQGCKGAGVDCAWILVRVYTAVGLVRDIPMPSYKGALARLHAGEQFYRTMIERFARPVTSGREPLPGDIVLFRVPLVSRRAARVISRATHGAIVDTWPVVIHAYSPARAVVATSVRADPLLGQNIEQLYTLPEWSA